MTKNNKKMACNCGSKKVVATNKRAKAIQRVVRREVSPTIKRTLKPKR